ncbi:MAG: hypothetical protein ACKV2Q_20350 [Planctomycetaceae bacterium]
MGELLAAFFSVGLGRAGVAASVVGLTVGFVLKQLSASLGRKRHRRDHDTRGPADLFGGQQFATEDIFARRELLSNASAEQLAEDGQKQMAVDALPAAALEVIQAQIFLGFAEAVFDGPDEFDTDVFVARDDVNAKIKGYLREKVKKVCVIGGPLGSGQLAAVNNALKDDRGVIEISVKNGVDFAKALTIWLGAPDFRVQIASQIGEVLCMAIEMRKKSEPLWLPTIVVKVDSRANNNTIENCID